MKARVLLPLLLLPVLLVACGGGGGGSSDVATDDVATVGSIHISKARFTDTITRFRASMKLQKQKFPKEGTSEYESVKAQAMWLLVLEAARQQEADKLGIDVPDLLVQSRIDALRKGAPFNGNTKKFEAELKKQGYTDASLRDEFRAVIISEQLTSHITEDLKVSDAAVHDYFVAHKADYPPSRDIQYVLVGKDKEATAADLKAQGQDPKKDKTAAKKVAAAYANPKAIANQIYAELKKGGDFAKLAKKYSQDETTKNSGGNLTAKKGEVVPKFGEIVFSPKTKQGLVEPFETPEYGWFVVKVLKPIKQSTEKDVAETIRQTLLQNETNETYTTWTSNLAKHVCTDGEISYQIGYTPNPDPCSPYTNPTTTTG